MTSDRQLDLIDRKALKANIEYIDWDRLARDGNLDDGINEVLHAIDEASIVDAVEVVHGRWKRTPTSRTLYCSVCDKIPECQIETNYCPNCGAKMDRGTVDG